MTKQNEKVSFEDACELSGHIITTENLCKDAGNTLYLYRLALAHVGWTSQELADESARRMKERLNDMKHGQCAETEGGIKT